jgi:hypothetical protein
VKLAAIALALVFAACGGGGGAGADGGASGDGGGGGGDGGDFPPPDRLEYRYTEHLGQLTGTARNSTTEVGMSGTDLGVAFASGGQVGLLFGDAWGDNRDSMALAPMVLEDARPVPDITWVTSSDGQFEPLDAPGVDLDAYDVPVEAVPAGDLTYYFFSSGYDFGSNRHTHSALAHGPGLEIADLEVDHIVPSDRFINVSVVVDGDDAWIFGNGVYRASPIYLARVPLAAIADRSAWRYWPEFTAGEESAAPLIDIDCAGEMSVRRQPQTGLWLMAYNCGTPERGIHLRTATAATGPWSEPHLIYTPDLGYQHFMHAREADVGHDDGLSETGREDEWGGEYGPYLVPDWFSSSAPGVYSIVYTLSSWNPYQVHLMRTVMAAPGIAAEPPPRGEELPPAEIVNGDFAGGSLAGWTASGDPFGTFQGDDGIWRVTTYVGAGDAATGTLWQEIAIDATTSELRFFLHGGDARVELHHAGEVVRRSHGRRDNAGELEVRWRLESYRGEKVKIVIVDDLTGAWGFVGARSFALY